MVEVASRRLPHPSRIVIFGITGDLAARYLVPALAALEESWRIVEPILDAWSSDAVPMLEYPAGSRGPAESRCRDGSDERP
jgi:glucose-6-phosphate 1-dehydrogenase